MSNIINKVKDAVAHHGDKKEHHSTGTTDANTYDSSRSSNYGPHDTNTGNAADPRVDSDRSSYGTSGVAGSTGNYGTTGTTGPTGTSSGYGTGATAGDAYDLNRSTNHGTHDSNIANKADPRIDSDRDGRASHGTTGLGGSTTGAYGSTGSAGYAPTSTHSSTTGAYGSTGSTGYAPTSTHSSTTQPMSTGAGSTGSTGYAPTSTHSSTTQPMSTGAGSTGPTGTSSGYGTGATAGDAYDLNRSTNHGTHDSNIANKADPRFDSDRDGRASHGSTGLGGSTGTYGSTGAAGTTAGTTGAYGSVPSEHSAATGPASSTAGPHDSNVANKADPRVDSDQSKKKEHLAGEYSGVDRFDKDVHKGSIAGGNQVIGLHGSKGPTTTKNFDQSQHESAAGSSYNTGGQTTAGPHKSDTLNKLDPRVDSDLDGSKTVGGNQTYAGSNTQTQRY